MKNYCLLIDDIVLIALLVGYYIHARARMRRSAVRTPAGRNQNTIQLDGHAFILGLLFVRY